MKRYIKKEEEIARALSEWVGISLNSMTTGIIIPVFENGQAPSYHLFLSNGNNPSPMLDCGSVEETVALWDNKYGMCDCAGIKDIWCFDSYPEMMLWFAQSLFAQYSPSKTL